jgi:hypothetical protein
MNRIRSNGTARNRSAAALIGTLGAIGVAVFAGSAGAEVVIHDNRDGTFKWERTIKFVAGDPVYGTFLDIRKPPTQSGERLPGTLGSWFRFNNSGSTPGRYQIEGYDQDVRVAIEDTEKKFTWNGQSLSLQPLRAYAAGEMILPNHLWPSTAMHYLSLPFIYDFQGGTPLIPDLAYFGVRVKTGTNQYNYGWVLFENWTNPLIWAYETEINKPIQVPIPSPGSWLIAVIPLTMTARRSRRSCKNSSNHA